MLSRVVAAAEERTMAVARSAREALAGLSDSEAKLALETLADLIVARVG